MTAIGFILGLAIFAWAIISGTREFQIFFNPHGLAIVFGGVIAAAFISYPFSELYRLGQAVYTIFKMPLEDPRKHVAQFAWWADVIRKRGLSAIEDEIGALPSSFLKDGMELLINGYTREEISENLECAIKQLVMRERIETGIFKTMAQLAPGFGLVGTLIGLIIMLRSMKDASSIAPSMATAMTATFYGVILANMIFMPMSVKLSRRTEARALICQIITDGVLLLYEKRPPAFVVDRLNSFLPPRSRIREFDRAAMGPVTSA